MFRCAAPLPLTTPFGGDRLARFPALDPKTGSEEE